MMLRVSEKVKKWKGETHLHISTFNSKLSTLNYKRR